MGFRVGSRLREAHRGYFDPDSLAGLVSAKLRSGVRTLQTGLVNPLSDLVFQEGHGDTLRLRAALAVRRLGNTASALLVDGARIRAGWNPEKPAESYGSDPIVYAEMLEESAFGIPRKTAALQAKYAARGETFPPPYQLNIGAPGVKPPQLINDVVKAAMDAGYTGYCPPSGLPEVRAAVAEHYSATYGHDVPLSGVYLAPSAKSNIYFAVHALLNPGDIMIVQCPAFPMHLSEPLKEGIRVIPFLPRIMPDGSLKHFPEDLDAIIRRVPTAKAVLLCSPSNPTGERFYPAELEGFADVLRRGGQSVIMDAIYRQSIWGNEPHQDLFGLLPEQTTLLDGISKAWAWTGGRVGWLVTMDPRFERNIERNGIGKHSCVNPALQIAAAVCLSDNEHVKGFPGRKTQLVDTFVRPYAQTLRANADWLAGFMREHLPECPFTMPEGAFYMFPNIEAVLALPGARRVGMDDEMFTDLALERGVAFLAGRGFGPTPNGERFVRFSFAGDLEKQVKPGAQRLVEVVDSLRS